jgi:hypothetical protein
VVGSVLTSFFTKPQVDDWKQFEQVSGRMSIALTLRCGKRQVGVVTFRMDTDTDMDSQIVILRNPAIANTRFCGADPALA